MPPPHARSGSSTPPVSSSVFSPLRTIIQPVPLTASAVGRRDIYADSEVTLVPPDGGPRFDPVVGYHVTWTQNLVNSVDER